MSSNSVKEKNDLETIKKITKGYLGQETFDNLAFMFICKFY